MGQRKGLTDSNGRPIMPQHAAQLNEQKPVSSLFENEDHTPLVNYRALGKAVAVQPFVVKRSQGGLELPSGALDTQSSPRGTVIGVGPDVTKVQIGQIVVSVSASVEIILNQGRNFVQIHEDDISGIEIKGESSAKDRPVGQDANCALHPPTCS